VTWVVTHVQPSHCSAAGCPTPPHEVVGDELPAPFERVEQGERPAGPGQREACVHLGHGQAPPGRGDRVGFAGVRLLPDPQRVQFGLEGGPVDGRGQARCAGGVGRRPAGVC
jgi:hypothetical protein